MSRFIIIGNGEIDDIRFLKKFLRKDYLIIAADGGYNHIRKLHKKPNYLIGDMDSVRDLPKNSNSIRLIKYPKSKDRTDTEIAVEFAIKNKASEILLFGMTSLSRIDHSLNNIFLLQNIADKRIINTLFVNKFTRISAVFDYIKIYKKNGSSVSLIPLSQKTGIIQTKGLKYKLKNDSLFRNNTRGISNIMVSKEAEIRLNKGILLVIQIIGKLK